MARKGRLGESDAIATVAVTDLERARRFYGEVLGFERQGGDEMGVAVYRSGAARLLVYPSEFAGTNRATSATWGVGDRFDDVIAELERAGVNFEHYDDMGMERHGNYYAAGSFKAAWFTDPDGNILHVNNG